MDPNTALARIIELSNRAIDNDPAKLNTHEQVLELAQELAETFEGLHEWLARGGFLPELWKKPEGGES